MFRNANQLVLLALGVNCAAMQRHCEGGFRPCSSAT